MNRPFTFSSPLSSPHCIQRLQKLVERKHFYFPAGLFGVVHVVLDSIETSINSFGLFLKCSTRGDSFLPFIYLTLHGEMRSSNGETRIQLCLKSDQPHSTAEWALYGFWVVLVTFTMAGGVIGILNSPPWQGIFIASMYVLAGIGGFWLYRQTYKISAQHLLNLIYHMLRHDGAETPSQNINEAEWLSSLAKSK